MPYDLYEFVDGEVKLSFKFKKGEKNKEEKEKFIALMQEALSVLKEELK